MRVFTAASIALSVLLAPLPVLATDHQRSSDTEDGVTLMEEGMRLLFEGLLTEMEPALDDLRDLVEEMEPGLQDLRDLIGDMGAYHRPEMLPNGDIIIRRKTPLNIEPPDEGEVDL